MMMSTQNAFYYDSSRCIECRACELACKSTNNVEPWVRWRRLTEEWSGTYPAVTRTFLSLACMHCDRPACASACPTGAIVKRPEDGIVVVDAEKCDGCRKCLRACPYDVPQFGSDGVAQICDFCLGIGLEPACAQACPVGALAAGPLDKMRAMAGGKTTRELDRDNTRPSIVIIAQE